jgi:hypothetical protein
MTSAAPRLAQTTAWVRAHVWRLALAGAIGVLLGITLPWTKNPPSEQLLTVFAWSCFLAASSFLIVLALRRRPLLRDRPWIACACLTVYPLIALSLWCPFPTDGLASIYFYFLIAGALHLLAFLLLALVLSPLAWTRSIDRYLALIERIGLFSVLLLLTGTILNAAWMTLVYRRFYYSQDTIVDWFPFIPFGQWVLNVTWGNKTGGLLGGAELWHLQALWLLFTVLAWSTAIFGYRRIVRLLAAEPWLDGGGPPTVLQESRPGHRPPAQSFPPSMPFVSG